MQATDSLFDAENLPMKYLRFKNNFLAALILLLMGSAALTGCGRREGETSAQRDAVRQKQQNIEQKIQGLQQQLANLDQELAELRASNDQHLNRLAAASQGVSVQLNQLRSETLGTRAAAALSSGTAAHPNLPAERSWGDI